MWRRTRFVAVEIGPTCVGMAEFRREGSRLRLLRYAFADAPDSGVPFEVGVATAARKVFEAGGLRGCRLPAVVGIDGQELFFGCIRRDESPADALPAPDAMTHAVGEPDEAGTAAVTAVDRERAEAAGFAVRAAGPEEVVLRAGPPALALALCRFFGPEEAAGALAVRIEGRNVDLVLCDVAPRVFFRATTLAEASFAALDEEAGRSVAYWRRFGAGSPRFAICAGTPGRIDSGERLAGVPVRAFDPLRCVETVLDPPPADRIRLGVLIGLGLAEAFPSETRVADLTPPGLRRSNRRRRRRRLAIFGTWTLAMLTFSGTLALRKANEKAAARVEALKRIVVPAERAWAELEPLEREVDELEFAARRRREMRRTRRAWSRIWTTLSRSLPEGVYLRELSPLNDPGGHWIGVRLEAASWLDCEPPARDVVTDVRDRLRAEELFSDRTRVVCRPAKSRFVRTFSIEAFFEESEAEQ